MTTLLFEEVTKEIIGAAFEVQRELGYGFLEKVYKNAMVEELQRRGTHAVPEYPIKVYYKGVLVGDYQADLLVADKVIVEIKVEKEYNPKHEAQLLHYLKATGIRVGILLNFGEKKCEYKRLVM